MFDLRPNHSDRAHSLFMLVYRGNGNFMTPDAIAYFEANHPTDNERHALAVELSIGDSLIRDPETGERPKIYGITALLCDRAGRRLINPRTHYDFCDCFSSLSEAWAYVFNGFREVA